MDILKNTMVYFCETMIEKASSVDVNTRSFAFWGEPEFPTDTEEE